MDFFKFDDDLNSLEDVLQAKQQICCELIKKTTSEVEIQNTLYREGANKILSEFKKIAKPEELSQYRFVLIPSLSITPDKIGSTVEEIFNQQNPRVRWHLYSRYKTGLNNRKDKIEVKRLTRSNERLRKTVPSRVLDLALEHEVKIKMLIELAVENRKQLRALVKKQKTLLEFGVIYDI